MGASATAANKAPPSTRESGYAEGRGWVVGSGQSGNVLNGPKASAGSGFWPMFTFARKAEQRLISLYFSALQPRVDGGALLAAVADAQIYH